MLATLCAVPPDEDEMSLSDVVARLGISESSVRRLGRDRLPYRETPGGTIRRGRRIYKRADVERLAAELAGHDPVT